MSGMAEGNIQRGLGNHLYLSIRFHDGRFSCWVAHDNLHIHQRVELRRARIEKITKRYPLESADDG